MNGLVAEKKNPSSANRNVPHADANSALSGASPKKQLDDIEITQKIASAAWSISSPLSFVNGESYVRYGYGDGE